MSKYDEIMMHLDPRIIIEKTQTPYDNARAGCTLQSSIVGSYSEFDSLVTAFVVHVMETAQHGAPPIDHCQHKARTFLDNTMGFDNAVYTAMSGAEGGMQLVLNNITDGFKEEAKRAYFNYILDSYVEPMNFDEIVELMTELQEKIGAYSPESFGYVTPYQMAGKYREILWNYIDSLTRYRNLWSY